MIQFVVVQEQKLWRNKNLLTFILEFWHLVNMLCLRYALGDNILVSTFPICLTCITEVWTYSSSSPSAGQESWDFRYFRQLPPEATARDRETEKHHCKNRILWTSRKSTFILQSDRRNCFMKVVRLILSGTAPLQVLN